MALSASTLASLWRNAMERMAALLLLGSLVACLTWSIWSLLQTFLSSRSSFWSSSSQRWFQPWSLETNLFSSIYAIDLQLRRKATKTQKTDMTQPPRATSLLLSTSLPSLLTQEKTLMQTWNQSYASTTSHKSSTKLARKLPQLWFRQSLTKQRRANATSTS